MFNMMKNLIKQSGTFSTLLSHEFDFMWPTGGGEEKMTI